MLHGFRQVELGNGESLGVGYVVCFSAPTCQVLKIRRAREGEGKPEIDDVASLSRDQLHQLIAALEAIRDEMPDEGP